MRTYTHTHPLPPGHSLLRWLESNQERERAPALGSNAAAAHHRKLLLLLPVQGPTVLAGPGPSRAGDGGRPSLRWRCPAKRRRAPRRVEPRGPVTRFPLAGARIRATADEPKSAGRRVRPGQSLRSWTGRARKEATPPRRAAAALRLLDRARAERRAPVEAVVDQPLEERAERALVIEMPRLVQYPNAHGRFLRRILCSRRQFLLFLPLVLLGCRRRRHRRRPPMRYIFAHDPNVRRLGELSGLSERRRRRMLFLFRLAFRRCCRYLARFQRWRRLLLAARAALHTGLCSFDALASSPPAVRGNWIDGLRHVGSSASPRRGRRSTRMNSTASSSKALFAFPYPIMIVWTHELRAAQAARQGSAGTRGSVEQVGCRIRD